MGNISYFCIVKRFRRFLIHTALSFFLLLTHSAYAQQEEPLLISMDSVDISLLTCQPRDAVYSLYGHTAIRVTDKSRGSDYAVNYGLFSFDKPFFIPRFVFGLTDYEMGACRFDDFKVEYEHAGCGVRQQRLNLTRAEKLRLLRAIDTNLRPENCVYRYNYFYDNCTTRARDIITRCIEGKVRYDTQYQPTTYREMTHAYNEHHRWARFGNDLLLGVKADVPISFGQHQFLPFSLSDDFERAVIKGNDGTERRLVAQTSWAVTPKAKEKARGNGVAPLTCAWGLLAVVIAFCAADLRRQRLSWWFDAVLTTASGLAGMILLAMVFSQHPTVSLNLQILLLNPLALAFAYPTIKGLRQQRATTWLTVWPLCIVLFAIGGLFQTYAEGMYVVALSLLIRLLFIILYLRKK